MKRFQVLTGGTTLGLLAAAGVLGIMNGSEKVAVAMPNAAPAPQQLQLTGIVRDFVETGKPGGHADFEVTPDKGYGLYNGNVAATLGSDGKPVFTGGGWLTKTQWKDSKNRNICWTLYDASKGDVAGVKGANSKGGVKNADSFNKWYNDTPGTNLSVPVTITLVKQDSGSYVFDDKIDPDYSGKGGFFPIDEQLYGLSGGSPAHNFHFTFELHTTFVYHEGTGETFKFIGDDDVFVFINGKLVIDLGGIHSANDQFVSIDRLGLVDGQEYPLDFFFAERHRTQSNCRIQTNLKLNSTAVPSVTAAFV
jgi:fibro-slime domain-containing protein